MNTQKIILCLLTISLTFACSQEEGSSLNQEQITAEYLPQFESEEALNRWVQEYARTQDDQSPNQNFSEVDSFEEQAAPSSADESTSSDSGSASQDSAEPVNESITNTQEADVDEGGIVKNIGDYLVILRRGHLFSVRISESAEAELIDSIAVARDELLKENVWYDEMLVKGDQVVVLGYRYIYLEEENIYGSTEINTFTLGEDGEFDREASHWMESYDYYDSDNSASRLVDGTLVLYMPHSFLHYHYDEFVEPVLDEVPSLPRVSASYPRRINYEGEGMFTVGERLVDPRRISYIEGESASILHNIVRCPILTLSNEGPLECEGHAVLSDFKEEMYVSASHTFLKISNQLFALSLTDESRVRRHKIEGIVHDQFAFKQIDDDLWVSIATIPNEVDMPVFDGTITVAEGQEEAEELEANEEEELSEDRPQVTPTKKNYIVKLPLSQFNARGDQSFADLDKIEFYRDQRWGTSLVKQRYFGTSQYIAVTLGDEPQLHIVDLGEGSAQSMEIPGHVTRLELMGSLGAFMALQSEAGLQVATAIHLDSTPQLVLGQTFENQSEAETRSHGFYFKPDETGGRLGLPVVNQEYGRWEEQSASIAFFHVNQEGEINKWGEAQSGDQSGLTCTSSCVDWYGNTRPLFLKGRVYALMGGELAELSVNDGSVRPIGDRVLLAH